MSKYSQGSAVEREVRSYLYREGAVLVMKAAGSKIIYPKWWGFTKVFLRPKIDLIALVPALMGGELHTCLIQVKKHKKLTADDLTELRKFSSRYSMPVYLAWKEAGEIKMELV